MAREGTYQAVMVRPGGRIHREFINGHTRKMARDKIKELFPDYDIIEFITREMSENEKNTEAAEQDAKRRELLKQEQTKRNKEVEKLKAVKKGK